MPKAVVKFCLEEVLRYKEWSVDKDQWLTANLNRFKNITRDTSQAKLKRPRPAWVQVLFGPVGAAADGAAAEDADAEDSAGEDADVEDEEPDVLDDSLSGMSASETDKAEAAAEDKADEQQEEQVVVAEEEVAVAEEAPAKKRKTGRLPSG